MPAARRAELDDIPDEKFACSNTFEGTFVRSRLKVSFFSGSLLV